MLRSIIAPICDLIYVCLVDQSCSDNASSGTDKYSRFKVTSTVAVTE